MAGIRKKGDGYHCTFRFQGRRYYFAVGNVSEDQARAKGLEVDETLALLERGRLEVPEGVALEEFVAAGGKAPVVSARPETVTARQLFDRYLATHANGTLEASSLGTARTHLNQLAGSLGERFRAQALTLLDLQGHVDRRRKKGVSPVTLKKEVATLRACWNWAAQAGVLKGAFPGSSTASDGPFGISPRPRSPACGCLPPTPARTSSARVSLTKARSAGPNSTSRSTSPGSVPRS
jgi:hypothetical protein